MPRGVIRASGVLVHTDSAKKTHNKPASDAAKPHHSQSGLTKVNLVAQHPYEGFNPTKFAKGSESRMFGVHESVVSNTMAETHPGVRVNNLRHMVESTVGDAYNLANSGVLKNTTGSSHHDSIHKGTGGIGPVKTQPERYGQVPFGGPKY
jgi:hypothetical protein